MCRAVLDLYDREPGAAALTIRMGESGGRLPASRGDRAALAEVLEREFKRALDELLLD